jgi:hypothetical protein
MRTLICGMLWWAVSGGMQAAVSADQLPAQPAGIGRPAADRAWWDAWAKTPEAAGAMKAAEAALKAPMPAFDPERYLDYTTNGDRTRYQNINSRRWDRFKHLVLGECLEGKGRFVPAIDGTVRSLCADPSWILPAHDSGAQVFKGASPYADLGVAMNGYQMAVAAWLLDGRLPAETTRLMRENVSTRLTGPVLGTIDGTAPPNVISGHWWAKANHNWNAVCTAGAVGAILATEPSPEVRAKAVDWAVKNSAVFLSGFGKDGYCSEGLGYWNYGFGHFAVLAEVLRAQTGGRVDLFKNESVRWIAAAPARLEIADGVYPSFADCGLNSRPDAQLVELVKWRLVKEPFTGRPSLPLAGTGLLYQTLTELVARQEAESTEAPKRSELPLRSWFEDSGVCVFRPAQPGGMAVALKGGHNAEHHNHNDVGTTVVVWKGRPVIADPGAMVYRAETFSKDRYRLPIMGSFGHSVPVVAGFLQAAGAQCRGKLLDTIFDPKLDLVKMDLSSAYPSSGVKKLERGWSYQRDAGGILVIHDRFEFDKPSTFETALVGLGDWYLVAGKQRLARFVIDGGKGALLQVNVAFSGPGEWRVTKINNPGKPAAIRLGLALTEPAADGVISMEIRPLPEGDKAPRTKLPVVEAPEKLADARKAP